MQTTMLLSVDAAGNPAQQATTDVAMSADGTTFVLASMADLAGQGDPHATPDAPAGAINGPGHAVYVRAIPRGV